jgi:hypothetical protein
MARPWHGDYHAMLAQLQQHPDKDVVVWRQPLTTDSAQGAGVVANRLRDYIRHPHRATTGRIACREEKCVPFHTGHGEAMSRVDRGAGEALVIGRWNTTPHHEASEEHEDPA